MIRTITQSRWVKYSPRCIPPVLVSQLLAFTNHFARRGLLFWTESLWGVEVVCRTGWEGDWLGELSTEEDVVRLPSILSRFLYKQIKLVKYQSCCGPKEDSWVSFFFFFSILLGFSWVFSAMSNWKETRTCWSDSANMEKTHIPPEDLKQVAGEREIQTSLLGLLPS